MICPRCSGTVEQAFYGPCEVCRLALRAKAEAYMVMVRKVDLLGEWKSDQRISFGAFRPR